MPPPESSHSTLQGYRQQPSQEPPVSSSALRGQQLPLGVHPPPCSIHNNSDQQALHTSRSPQRYQPIREQEAGSQDPDYRLPPPINRQFLLAMADHATPYDRFTAADEDDLEGYDVPDINIYSPQNPAYHSYANPNSLGKCYTGHLYIFFLVQFYTPFITYREITHKYPVSRDDVST